MIVAARNEHAKRVNIRMLIWERRHCNRLAMINRPEQDLTIKRIVGMHKTETAS
jgi:hypothetical protein